MNGKDATAGAPAIAEVTVSAHPDANEKPHGRYLLGLSIASLGIVYGDIGTSPLYAVRQCFLGEHGVTVNPANILGILSLIVWSLNLIISLKYVAYVMRADNKGEGGILSLMALASSGQKRGGAFAAGVTLVGLFGAALLYGDGMITPAISVLSAVEGLELAAPNLTHYVVPLTVLVLVGLFLVQRRGTAGVGAVFGPVMLLWFIAIACLGVRQVLVHPEVLWAFSPVPGVLFLANNGRVGLLVLGAVFLAVTGGEALYADMGHFGKRPVRLTWFTVVLPSLLCNYFGQGAALLGDPSAVENPFYRLAPTWALYPMIGLSTVAAVIASQALISGAFSLTRQATMLGFWPRVQVKHTSTRQIGQIYVPMVNWLLMAATIGLVMGFGSSNGLAAAYGIAVTMTMVITTLLAYVVARHVWGWGRLPTMALTLAFLVPDVAFLAANIVKVRQGGWFPIFVGVFVLLLMTTWKKGRQLLAARIRDTSVVLDDFFELVRVERPARVPGTAVFMTGSSDGTPPALLRNFLHNRVVHEHNILLTVVTEDVPRISENERLTTATLQDGFVRITARYGFAEEPNMPALLARGGVSGYDPEYTSFFFGRETLLAEGSVGMAPWRKRLFTFMTQSSQRATAFFHIPPDKVVELGSQVEL